MRWQRYAAKLVPALCAACSGRCESGTLVCEDCLWDLDDSGPILGEPPPGVDVIVSVASHEGIGRALLAAYKFRGLRGLDVFMAARMADLVRVPARRRTVVAVPPAKLRQRFRGFDPAGQLGVRLAEHLGWPLAEDLLARRGSGRQRGADRARRIQNPPRIEALREAPAEVLLIDDVATTGATLGACSLALRGAGARRIEAITFTRRE